MSLAVHWCGLWRFGAGAADWVIRSGVLFLSEDFESVFVSGVFFLSEDFDFVFVLGDFLLPEDLVFRLSVMNDPSFSTSSFVISYWIVLVWFLVNMVG